MWGKSLVVLFHISFVPRAERTGEQQQQHSARRGTRRWMLSHRLGERVDNCIYTKTRQEKRKSTADYKSQDDDAPDDAPYDAVECWGLGGIKEMSNVRIWHLACKPSEPAIPLHSLVCVVAIFTSYEAKADMVAVGKYNKKK